MSCRTLITISFKLATEISDSFTSLNYETFGVQSFIKFLKLIILQIIFFTKFMPKDVLVGPCSISFQLVFVSKCKFVAFHLMKSQNFWRFKFLKIFENKHFRAAQKFAF